MKNKIIFFVVLALILLTKNTYCQTFRFGLWGLNETVTIDAIISYLNDKSKLITDPSLYRIGDDIKFYNELNTITTFSFKNNTQILECIYISELTNLTKIKDLKSIVFSQLGQPSWGYEKNIHIHYKNNKSFSDNDQYKYEFRYLISGNKISIRVYPVGVKINGNYMLNEYSFSACISKAYESDFKFPDYITTSDNSDYYDYISTCTLINKW